MKRRFRPSTTHLILISFFCAIFIGSLLLSLPISSASGKGVPYIDALFTATTSVCVTGLTTLTTATAWSIFGQAVILLLIQIGGLGVITVISMFFLMINKNMGLSDRLLLRDAFNLNTLSGISSFLKRVTVGTLAVEGVGALLYMTVFVRDFGAKGIWMSIFTSVSAFCNAGLDLIGSDSLCMYVSNPVINITTCLLITLGGIGYIVWWDVLRVSRKIKQSGLRALRHLTLHSKIAITASLSLLFGGALLIFVFEYDNPQTIGGLNLGGKIWASIFQSVTTRTAGFFTIPQQSITNATAYVSLILMFIGGSPVGTAGGVKTVTIATLIATAHSAIHGKNGVCVFNRRLSRDAIYKAVGVVFCSFAIMTASTIMLSLAADAPSLDIIYETCSATATVGLTRGITTTLNTFGKSIVIATMYFGRVGPISLAFAFTTRRQVKDSVSDPTEDVSIG